MSAARVLIVGAGASGLLAAVKLLQAGFDDVVLLEKASRLGGTWRDNVYPGLTCDVPSHLYTFSFEPNPEWSRTYAPQAEILAYLEGVAGKYGLRIRFGAEVTRARFDQGWEVTLRDGERLRADFLFSAPGGLEYPKIPDLPGLEAFRGDAFHSARWRVGYDFSGKTVAVVGSAASAVQLLPEVAAQAERVYLFQRTANWVVPKADRLYKEWQKALMRRFPALGRLYRGYLFARLEWAHRLFRKHSPSARLVEKLALLHMRRIIRDKRLREALTPTYPLGCKRILLSDDFYPTLTRPNLEVVSGGVVAATEGGLVSQDGRPWPVDTVVWATGFQVYASPIRLEGLGGRPIWPDGPEAYQGVSVAGFPNLFLLLGPNSALGHNSVWLMGEAQADFAIRAMREVERRGAAYLDVRPESVQRYNQALARRFEGMVWSAGCSSWYKTPEGKIFTLYPGDVRSYRRELEAPDWDAYEFCPARATSPLFTP